MNACDLHVHVCLFRLTLSRELQRRLKLNRIRPHQILQFLEQLFGRDKKAPINPIPLFGYKHSRVSQHFQTQHTQTYRHRDTDVDGNRSCSLLPRSRLRVPLQQVIKEDWKWVAEVRNLCPLVCKRLRLCQIHSRDIKIRIQQRI